MKRIYYLLLSLLPFGASSQAVQLNLFASGLQNPVEVVHCGDSRLFVVQQNGIIKIVQDDGTVLPDPFLNISALTSSSGERGLLGLAFHPQFHTNGQFFVNYTRASDGSTVIARYYAMAGSNVADPLGEEILVVPQPASNHNGGCIRFGPDGYLYIGMGDGGGGGDPFNTGQDKQSLLGKMLRIDVNTSPYVIPASNPYADGENGLPEIYSIGLRNPWKFSFDTVGEQIWIADVGQNAWEEINAQPYTDNTLNYGWRCYEGLVAYNMADCDPNASYVSPIHVFSNNITTCSVTGGYVYRGSVNPDWYGKYFYTDYCSNEIYVLNPTNGNVQTNTGFTGSFATFGQDFNGELYVAGRGNGNLYKLTAPNASISTTTAIDIALMPNPTTGVFEIKADAPIVNAHVFDVDGRLIKEVSQSNKIDLTNAPKGVYFVNCQTDSGQKTIKLVLQ